MPGQEDSWGLQGPVPHVATGTTGGSVPSVAAVPVATPRSGSTGGPVRAVAGTANAASSTCSTRGPVPGSRYWYRPYRGPCAYGSRYRCCGPWYYWVGLYPLYQYKPLLWPLVPTGAAVPSVQATADPSTTAGLVPSVRTTEDPRSHGGGPCSSLCTSGYRPPVQPTFWQYRAAHGMTPSPRDTAPRKRAKHSLQGRCCTCTRHQTCTARSMGGRVHCECRRRGVACTNCACHTQCTNKGVELPSQRAGQQLMTQYANAGSVRSRPTPAEESDAGEETDPGTEEVATVVPWHHRGPTTATTPPPPPVGGQANPPREHCQLAVDGLQPPAGEQGTATQAGAPPEREPAPQEQHPRPWGACPPRGHSSH